MIQLVKRSISGDADAFLELMEKNSLAMYKVARGILDNDEDAADAMQDTILTCFEKIHTLKNPEYFKTWMIRILINECNKIHRHYKNFSRAEELPEVPGQDMSSEEFEFKEMLRVLCVTVYFMSSSSYVFTNMFHSNEALLFCFTLIRWGIIRKSFISFK